jgi:4-hydroxy-tetrahydrodipicolinate synthase
MNYNELKEALKGVVIVQVTPFREDGSLDLEGLIKNTRWSLDRIKGKDFSFMIEGSNGEFFNQSEEEWKKVVKSVINEIDGKFPALVHVGQCSTQETIKRAQYAQSMGADGIIAVLPYYIQPQEEGMYLHYKKICESVDIGVICYNNTAVSGAWVRPHLFAEIAKIPNFVGVKENTSNIISFRLTQQAVGSNAVVMCGRGEEIYPYEARFGCPGFVSFIANFAPELAYEMYTLAMKKQYDKLEEFAKIFTPFFKDASVICNLPTDSSFLVKVSRQHGRSATISGGGASMQFAIVKEAMNIIGLNGGVPRLPLTSLTSEEKEELGDIIKKMGI